MQANSTLKKPGERGVAPLDGARGSTASSGRYVVEAELAAGGMGVVYRARDRVTGEQCALKRMTREASERPYLAEAFAREYQVLKTLDHPRIIKVFDYAIDGDGPFYTMELLDGADMRRAAPMPPREVCACLRDVATSLSLLHARRMLHRDLSPGNVRMTKDGRCKLLDFGALASFGSSHVVVGTPPFVAPEAMSFAPLDARTDLYSLGALAYWLLTGRHAFPTSRLDALIDLWRTQPAAPSTLAKETPPELDALVLSLLSIDPRGRPASAAEVIARLTVIGGLTEDAGETEQLAMSFLSTPRFVGRGDALLRLRDATEAALRGRGGALTIEAVAGMGRSRLLEEFGVAAQLAGATVVRVDSSTSRQAQGTAAALTKRVMDAIPLAAQRYAHPLLGTLRAEDRFRFGERRGPSEPPAIAPQPGGGSLEEWLARVSRDTPLVLQVDNVEDADDASLGVLAAVAKAAVDLPLLLVTTLGVGLGDTAIGLSTLRERSTRIELGGLTAIEMLELTRSLFGDTPKVERFAEWLFERTAGSPLHAVELSRQLLLQDVIRYRSGVWALPDRAPDAELPAALGDALSVRIGRLTQEARILAQCLSLQREQPTLELCRLLLDGEDDRSVLFLLDELARQDVLHFDSDGYSFSSTALREALLAKMQSSERTQNHRRLGNAFIRLAGRTGVANSALQLEAGFHLILGGDEQRGAEAIAGVTHDALTGTLIANLHRAGPALDAALRVYNRDRRSVYERMPLLAALAQAGFYEDRSWGDRYGTEALDVLEDLSGLRSARFLRRFLGRWLGLIVGIITAFLRFQLSPKGERKYSFDKILVQLFTAVTTLTGAASLSLDPDRAAQIAAVLEPFSMLPARLTPVGIYRYCCALQHIARDTQPEAYDTFTALLATFEDPRYYPTLPADARALYVAGAHFARGAMGVLRSDGRGALQSADALDQTGLKLYAMIASQLRWLYYTLRGEVSKAAPHRDLLEEHAAHVGSVWQVETWQSASLTLVYGMTDDIVNCTRTAYQLEFLGKRLPSLERHSRLAQGVLLLLRSELSSTRDVASAFASRETGSPRTWVAWSASEGYMARAYNLIGEHAEAKKVCEAALSLITERDRDFAPLFFVLEQQLAVADAELGRVDDALARIDHVLLGLEGSNHPLLLGMCHDTRAGIAWRAGRIEDYTRDLAEAERWFLPTEAPLLIARCQTLRDLAVQSFAPSSPEVEQETTDTVVVGDSAAP